MRKNKGKKFTKNQKKLLVILAITLGLELILIGYKVLVKYVFTNHESTSEVETEKKKLESDKYNYYLSSNATEYETELFEELEKILSEETIVWEDYATTMTKLFISDLFTLNNKKSSSDITSSQFVWEDYRETFTLMVKDTIYSNIELNLTGDREQDLPIVKKVEVESISHESFSLGEEVLDSEAFVMDVSIEYETDLEYPTSCKVIVAKSDDLLQVVKLES